jgi:uncharacterized protein YciI
MKHFIVEITYLLPVEQLAEIVPVHRAFLKRGYEQGLLLCSGPLNPRTGGMVIARAESLEALQAFFSQDPYLAQPVARHRYVEFDPVLRQAWMEDWIAGK